jgi:hypothetical protein
VHEDVVEALAADRADDTLREGVLPGCAWGGGDLADRHTFDSPPELIAGDTVSITEQVGRSRIIRERLDKLAGGPGCRGMVGDVEVDGQAAVVAKDDEGEQQAEGEGGDDEEVDRDELSGVRRKEGAPRGRWPRRGPVHVLGDGQLGDLVADQSEFGLDAAAAQVGFSRAIWRISWRIAESSRGRPTRAVFDFHRQESWKPRRCQASTVAG